MSYLKKKPLPVTDGSTNDCFSEHFLDSGVHGTTVEALFQRHIGAFSTLPGQVSEFRLSEVGYEWRCEYDIGGSAATVSPGKGASLLLFSLMDLPDHRLPTAALYLLARVTTGVDTERYTIPLESLEETHEALNEHLLGYNATIEMLVNADRFIAALVIMRERLGGQVVWH